MKKISFIGDSILMVGYGDPVMNALKEEGYDAWRPEPNARFAQMTMRILKDDLERFKGSEIIHWNNGLHDQVELFGDGAFTPLEQYVQTMLRVSGYLKKYAKKVIFATTTPVHPDFPHHSFERTKLYNDTLVPLLEKEGVIINDLFSAMVPHRIDGISEDLVHLNPLGIDVCAKQTLDVIHKTLSEIG